MDKFTYSICRTRSHRGHNHDDDVLLDGEGTGVKRGAKNLDAGHDTLPQTHDREGKEQGNEGTDGDRGIAELKIQVSVRLSSL